MKICYILINLLLISFIKGNYIKLNFYKDKYKSAYHIDNVFFASMVTDIYLGTPQFKISLQISTDSPFFVIKGDSSPTEYKQENSTSFYFIKYGGSYEYKKKYFHSIFFQENYKIENKNINLNTMMYWGKYPISHNYGLIGLQLHDIKFNESNIFLNQLYDKQFIKDKIFTLIYQNENKGELFIGELPFNKTKLLKGKKFKICKNNFITNGIIYATKFEEIKFRDKYFIFKNIEIKENNYPAIFSNAYYGFIGSKEYNNYIYQTFFKPKLVSKSCWTQNIDDDRFYGYVCTRNIDTSSISNVKFFHKELNYTFEIENKEMWVYYNNIKYFIIFFSYVEQYSWTLGQKFLEKYTFVFNGEKNLIGFYYLEIKNKDYTLYLILILLAFIIPICLCFRYFHFIKYKKIDEGIELEDIFYKKDFY